MWWILYSGRYVVSFEARLQGDTLKDMLMLACFFLLIPYSTPPLLDALDRVSPHNLQPSLGAVSLVCSVNINRLAGAVSGYRQFVASLVFFW